MMSSRNSLDFLFVTSGLPLYPRGGQIALSQLTRRLVRNNYRVGILYLKDIYGYLQDATGDPSIADFMKSRPRTYRPFERFINSRTGYFFLPFVRRLSGIEFRESLRGVSLYYTGRDIENVEVKRMIATAWQAAYFVNSYRRKTKKYYLVQHEEDDPSFSGSLSPLATNSYSFNLQKIVLNDRVYERFLQDSPIKIHIAGFEKSQFHVIVPVEKRDGKTILVPVRRFEDKGARYAIEAMDMIHRERPDIRIISFGNYPSNLVPEFIDHRGIVSHDTLLELYNSASIFVFPSVIEGFGLPGVEAMASGCAVVTTDNGGVREYVKEDETGMIVPIRDPAALKNAVISLVDDQEKRIKLASNGLLMAREFTFENMYLEFVDAIKSHENKIKNEEQKSEEFLNNTSPKRNKD